MHENMRALGQISHQGAEKKPNELSPPGSSPSPSKEVTLQVSLSDKVVNEPMKIKVPYTIFERITRALEERSLKPEFVAAGAVIFVAAATTAGIVVAKKVIERRGERQAQETSIPVLNEEQREEYTLMWDSSYRKIISYIRWKVGNDQDAENLTQEVFLRAYRHFPPGFTYPDLPNPYLPWLYRIAHNVVSNSYRDTRKEREKSGGSIEDEESFPRPKRKRSPVESIVISREEEAELQERIASLTGPYPLVIWLKTTLSLSNKEIAEILGKTEGAIKSLYWRALRSLEKILRTDGFGESLEDERDVE